MAKTMTMSSKHVREANTRAVLDVLWDSPVQTGSDLIGATGLTRATVHDVCDELVRLGWVHEIANSREHGDYTKGRPARRYAFDPGAGVVLGIDAGLATLTVTVADLRGDILAQTASRWSMTDAIGAARADHIAERVQETLIEAGITGQAVLAAGIGVPAPVGRDGRTVIDANPFWRAANPDLADHLEARWDWPVLVDNDANLAALAEGWLGAGINCSDYVTMLSGERLGSGVVLDGRLLRGARGRAGELVVFDRIRGIGSTDGLAALARAWGRDARAEAGLDTTAWPAVELIDAECVFALAADGDPVATAILERLQHALTHIVATLTEMFDPDLVVLAGAVAPAAAPLIDRVAAQLAQDETGSWPKIVASQLGEGIVSLGALRRALDHVKVICLDIDLESDGTQVGQHV